jgi:hypothetical protein
MSQPHQVPPGQWARPGPPPEFAYHGAEIKRHGRAPNS